MSLFEVTDLRKNFGGIQALDGVDLSVEEGELVGLIGPNGAGKTTLFNCVSGMLDPTRGEVYFEGESVAGREPHELARRGMVRTFQLTRELTTMTVMENVLVAARDHPGERALPAVLQTDDVRREEAEVTRRAEELLEQFDLQERRNEYAGKLSIGERKALELARALMLDPELLMLDEPYAGMNEAAIEDISNYITRLNDDGMTFVIVEHGLEDLVELVDRLVVLHEGRVLADGPTEEVVNDERVVNVYIGKPIEA